MDGEQRDSLAYIETKLEDLEAKINNINEFVEQLKSAGIAMSQQGGMSGMMMRNLMPPSLLNPAV